MRNHYGDGISLANSQSILFLFGLNIGEEALFILTRMSCGRALQDSGSPFFGGRIEFSQR